MVDEWLRLKWRELVGYGWGPSPLTRVNSIPAGSLRHLPFHHSCSFSSLCPSEDRPQLSLFLLINNWRDEWTNKDNWLIKVKWKGKLIWWNGLELANQHITFHSVIWLMESINGGGSELETIPPINFTQRKERTFDWIHEFNQIL